jgi:hypothetical protein
MHVPAIFCGTMGSHTKRTGTQSATGERLTHSFLGCSMHTLRMSSSQPNTASSPPVHEPCCICLDTYEPLKPMECCRSTVHVACLERWHLESHTCPVCRSGNATVQDADEEHEAVGAGGGANNFVAVHVQAARMQHRRRRRRQRLPAWLPALCMGLSAAAYFAVRALTG